MPDDIQAMVADLTRRGTLSPTTVRYAYSVLRIALGRAEKMGRVTYNAATKIDPPSKATREMHPLSVDEARTFLGSLEGDRFAALYVVAIATGLRQGELLALRWSDIDLEAGTLTVSHTLQRGTRTLAEPKTARSRRSIVLPAMARDALLEHRRGQRVARIDGLVFATSAGTALDTRKVTRAFQARLAVIGLPRQRFHDLRHAFATMQIEAGEDIAVVSRILGHSNLSTTADVYAHLTPVMQRRSADRMDRLLASG
ncbi:MAG: tyrosine-type recombinase/integrase [Acidimicrobiales bacterium]